MIRLTKIYTKTGDGGDTSLGDGSRVAKTHPRIEAYGTVDELNAQIGAVLALGGEDLPERDLLGMVQNDLFDLGADLCLPLSDDEETRGAPPLRVRPEQVTALEEAIDRINEDLEPLESFILPGGTPGAALLHQARTLCRRAERQVLHLAARETVTEPSVVYLNRLSDLLFVLARAANQAAGVDEPLWRPGG